MIVIHALWSPGRGLLFRGLDGDRRVESASQAVRSARAHPFAADAEALAGIHAGVCVSSVSPLGHSFDQVSIL